MTKPAVPIKQTQTTAQPERTRGGRAYRPHVDIVETDAELLLVADVPGAATDAIDIDFDHGRLSVTARVDDRQKDDTVYAQREYGVGDFFRAFQVGETVDISKIDADLRNGVLTIRLPKTEAAKARKIAVKTR